MQKLSKKLKTPLVSIITPSFNQAEYIENTIKSIIEQDYPNIEYLVFDGGSTDGTPKILERYQSRLKAVSEKDRGQSDAVNKGFKAAKGEILGWLNSDDTYEPGAINEAVKHLLSNPEVMMVYGKGAHISDDGKFIEWYPTEPFDLKRLAETCFICQPAVFLRAEVFNKIKMLDVNLNYCMDYDLWIRIGKSFKVAYIPKHLANTRLYKDTKTLSKRVEAHAEIIDTVKKHYRTVPINWIYAYSHYILDRFLFRNNKIKDLIYVALLTILVPYYNYRINRKLPKFAEVREWAARFFKHLKSKGLRWF